MDAGFPDRLRKCADEMRRDGSGDSGAGRGAPMALEMAADELADLRELVVHCWVHSGYPQCGYRQMTTEQKAMFDGLTANAS